jgi:hypothetical protein
MTHQPPQLPPDGALIRRMDAYLSGESAEATAIIKDARAALQSRQPAAPVAPVAAVPEGLRAQVLDALRDGLSVCMSVSVSRDRKIARDGVTLYAQTEEWCRWLDSEVGPKIRSAVDALAASPTPPVQPDADVLRDAERYRWLRSDDIEVPDGQREISVVQHRLPFSDDPDITLIESEMDAAIDTAMALTAAQAEGGR